MGAYDDLIPTAQGRYDDLIPAEAKESPRTRFQKLAAKASGAVKSIAEKFIDPETYQTPIKNRAEDLGKEVKGAAQESIGNLVERGMNPYAGAVASAATEMAPFTPSEFATAAAGELAPVAVSRVLESPAKSMANRFINAPKNIRESALMKAPVTADIEREAPKLGEQYLSMEGAPITNNKETIFNWSRFNIKNLSNQARDIINNLSSSSPVQIPKSEIIDKDVLDNVLDKMIQDSSKYEADRSIVDLLQKVRSSDSIDLPTANKLREIMGSEVGKKFTRLVDDLPGLTDAQKAIFSSLRQKIGQISPALDKILSKQHDLFNVQWSVLPDAAKGFERPSMSLFEMMKGPVESNLQLANAMNRLGERTGARTAAAAGAKSAVKEFERKRSERAVEQ